MPLSTILLKTGVISSSAPGLPVYVPSATDPKMVAIVESMRFTNTGSGTATLRAWFQKGGGTYSSSIARRILPYDQSIPPGYTLIDDDELTLDSGDGIYLQAGSGTIEFAFNGMERDLS